MATQFKKALLCLVLFASYRSHAQTHGSISFGGGTLNYEVTTTTGTLECGVDWNQRVLWTNTAYGNFQFSTGGTTTQLVGGTSHTFVNGLGTDCSSEPPASGPTTVTLGLESGGISNITVQQTTGRFSQISATASTTADPDYKLISILYAAPGNTSSTSFTNSITNGSVSTVSSSFTGSAQYTFSLGFATGSNSLSFGFSHTAGNSDAFTETITDGTSLANDNNSSSPNTVDHKNDLFILWLNPEVTAQGTTYNVQTQSQNGAVEPFDPVYLFASELQTNASGGTNVTTAHLNKQYNSATGANDLPGIAHICASISGPNPNSIYLAQYNNNACTQTTQCGCVPSDFTNLLALDPLVSSSPSQDATTATNPTAAPYDVSGNLCNNPSSSDNCRYVPVPCSDENCIFSGPSQPGGNHEQTSFTQTDSTQTVLTQTATTAESVGYGYKAGLAVGPSFSSQQTFTWTNTQSEGAISGQANQIGYSLGSNTVGCSESVLVFEDTVYHTFVLTQAPMNNSCP